MNEQKSIQRAYGETVETIFKVFFGEFTSGYDDPGRSKTPKSVFAKGTLHGQ